MQEFLNQLSKEIIYDSHHKKSDTLVIDCHIKKKDKLQVKTYYVRKIQDINFGSYKVLLNIRCPKYYVNRKIDPSSFTYSLDFADVKGRRTKRLSQYILDNLKEISAIGLERTLKKNVAYISDTTILRIIQKKTAQSIIAE